MLDALTQNSTDLTQIANHLERLTPAIEAISTSLQLMVYMGIALSVFYIGKSINSWKNN